MDEASCVSFSYATLTNKPFLIVKSKRSISQKNEQGYPHSFSFTIL